MKVNGLCVLDSEVNAALLAWDQWRDGHRGRVASDLMKSKVREICNRIHPWHSDDPAGPWRLAQVCFSLLGRRPRQRRSVSPVQLELFS